jgi:hypothetical protein
MDLVNCYRQDRVMPPEQGAAAESKRVRVRANIVRFIESRFSQDRCGVTLSVDASALESDT